ncbi:MAG TPA: OsmC family protein [Burkholderiales bacterium]|nr:OsmC family protein [Burkholderiales bacterium]
MELAKIRESIERTSAALAQNPAKARSTAAPLTARLIDGLKFEVKGAGGETVRTDMPATVGGEGSAPNPGWLMRAALAACTGTVIAMRAARTGVELTTLEVIVDGDTDQRRLLGIDDAAPSLTGLRVKARLGAEQASDEQLREIAAWGDAHSPVACTMRMPPAISTEVEIVR